MIVRIFLLASACLSVSGQTCLEPSENFCPGLGCIDDFQECRGKWYTGECEESEQRCDDRGCVDKTLECDECPTGRRKCVNLYDMALFTCMSTIDECGCQWNMTQCAAGECVFEQSQCRENDYEPTFWDLISKYAYIIVGVVVVVFMLGSWYRRRRMRLQQAKRAQPDHAMVKFEAGGDAQPNATVGLLPSQQQAPPPGSYPVQQQWNAAYPQGSTPYPPPQGGYPPQGPSYATAYPPNSAPQGNVPTYPPTSTYPPGAANAPAYPSAGATPYPPGATPYPTGPTSYPPHAERGDAEASTAQGAPTAPPTEGHSLTGAYTSPEYHGFDSSSVPPPPSYDSVTAGDKK